MLIQRQQEAAVRSGGPKIEVISAQISGNSED